MPTDSQDPADLDTAPDTDLDADLDADLDVPAPPPPSAPRLRRSAGLLATGVALLACQQVLGPIATFWVFAAEAGPSHGLSDTVTAAYVVVFGVGLVALLVGLRRFTSHVHALAVAAQQR